MSLITDVSASDFLPAVTSKNHRIVDEMYLQEIPSPNPEVEEKEYKSAGRQGVVAKSVQFTKYPFSVTIALPDPTGNPYKLIAADQNPYSKELGINESIGFFKGKEGEWMFLQKNSSGKIVAGRFFAGVMVSSVGDPINLDGGAEITIEGDAQIYRELLDAPNMEGVGNLVKVIEGSTPDTKAHIDYESDDSEERAMYLILDTGTFVPRKAYLPVIADADIPAFEGVDGTGHGGSSGDEVIDLLVAYETGAGYGDIALTIVQGTPVTPPATPTAPTLSDVATHVASLDGCDSSTRFCVLAEVFVDEDDTDPVVINTADITKYQVSALTYQRTPNQITKRTKQSMSDKFFDDYAYIIKVDGERETDGQKILTSDSTALTLSGSYDMIEALTGVAEYDMADLPLI